MSGGRHVSASDAGPSAVAADYARHAARLLERLAEPGTHAERREDRVLLVRKAGAVSTATGIPAGALADLLHSGAVRCETRQGRARFLITEAGRARLRRAAAEGDGFAGQHREIATRILAEGGAREVVRVNLREDALSLIRMAGLQRVSSARPRSRPASACAAISQPRRCCRGLPPIGRGLWWTASRRGRGFRSPRRPWRRGSGFRRRWRRWMPICAAS